MVTETGDGGMRRVAATRETRLETIGFCALGFAVLSIVTSIMPAGRNIAWLVAVPAVIFAFVALGMQVRRKTVATAALLVGWFAFSFSFAMMLWG